MPCCPIDCWSCSALMASSLRAGSPPYPRWGIALCLAVPSWRAVSVPAASRSSRNCSRLSLQCPHGGQSPCRSRESGAGHRGHDTCSALMAGSLRAGTNRGSGGAVLWSLAVPSWRAVSVPVPHAPKPLPALNVLQCPHGGQSPCRTRAPLACSESRILLQCPHGGQSPCRASTCSRPTPTPSTCSALMAGSLRAGALAYDKARATLRLQCPHGGQSPCRGPTCVVLALNSYLAVPSWRAVSVPVNTVRLLRLRGQPCSALMAGSLRAGAFGVGFFLMGFNLQCPHGGQSPCRLFARLRGSRAHPACSALMAGSLRAGTCKPSRPTSAITVLQCPHGGQSPCRASLCSTCISCSISCSALMAGSLRAGCATATRTCAGRTCSALMAGSLRAGPQAIGPPFDVFLSIPVWNAVRVFSTRQLRL